MQGRKAAEGTAWAARIIAWPVPQPGTCRLGLLVGSSKPTPKMAGTAKMASIPAARITRRALHRCSTIGCRCGASLRNSASRSRGSRFMKARSCVGLATPRVAANASRELGLGEIPQGPLVHAAGVGADREDQHHVAQVDRLAPW